MYNKSRNNMTSKKRAYEEWINKRQISKDQYTLGVRNYMDTMELIKFQAKSDFIKEVKVLQPFTYEKNLQRRVTIQE